MRIARFAFAFVLAWALVAGPQIAAVSAADVRDFGAKGDGKTNDTAAFVKAFAAGGRVRVPAGTYVLGPKPLDIPENAVLEGDGRATVLKPARKPRNCSGSSTARKSET